MGVILSIMNEKGGVGKSTLTYSIAWRLMQIGHRILVIDLDGQKANISYLAGIKVSDDTLTMQDVMLKNENIQDAIQSVIQSDEGCLDMIPAGINTSYMPPSVKISKFKKIVKSIKDNYDYIFIDVNPSPDWRHALTLSVLDCIAIIMLPDVMSLEANSGIFDSITEVQESFNRDLQVLGFILNQFDARTNLTKGAMLKANQMAEFYNTELFNHTVRKAVVMGESAVSHKGITEYNAKSAVASDVCDVTDELINRINSVISERSC